MVIIFENKLPLKSVTNISFFEKIMRYKLPKSFVEFVKKHNGSSPVPRYFDTDKCKERIVSKFLSFNPGSPVSVFNYQLWCKHVLKDKYIVFAIDPYGNLICFDREDDSVVFINLDLDGNDSIEKVADSFEEFLKGLFDIAVASDVGSVAA